MKTSFTVIGAGSWGTALALVLAHNGHDVSLWSRQAEHRKAMHTTRENHQYLPDIPLPDNITICDELIPSIHQHEHVLLAVPSHGFEGMLRLVHHEWPEDKGIIWATKGLHPQTGQFLSELADNMLGKNSPKAILTGPSFAKEVANKQPTAVTIAGNNNSFNQTMQACFQADYFRVYLTDDLIGAQLGGAVKNVLAIGVGIADGMGLGTNAKAGLMTRGLAEMIRLGLALGAKQETLIGLSGLGDLILTCSDNQSRNRRFGLAVGQGKNRKAACEEIGQVVEGITTTETIYQLAQKHQVRMPVTEQMYLLLNNQVTAQQALKNLTSKDTGQEIT